MERLDDAGVERIFAGDFASLHHFLFNIDRIAGMGLLGNVIGAQARGRDTVRLGFQMQGAGGSHGKLRLIQHIREGLHIPRPEIRRIRIGDIACDGGLSHRQPLRLPCSQIEKMNGAHGVSRLYRWLT